MPDIPPGLRYTEDHLWLRHESGTGVVRAGITDFAQESLGDVVAVTLPKMGTPVRVGEPCGEIESVKSVSDLVAPVTGTISASNDSLVDAAVLINVEPYDGGWLFEVEADPVSITEQLSHLLDAQAYRDLTGS